MWTCTSSIFFQWKCLLVFMVYPLQPCNPIFSLGGFLCLDLGGWLFIFWHTKSLLCLRFGVWVPSSMECCLFSCNLSTAFLWKLWWNFCRDFRFSEWNIQIKRFTFCWTVITGSVGEISWNWVLQICSNLTTIFGLTVWDCWLATPKHSGAVIVFDGKRKAFKVCHSSWGIVG